MAKIAEVFDIMNESRLRLFRQPLRITQPTVLKGKPEGLIMAIAGYQQQASTVITIFMEHHTFES